MGTVIEVLGKQGWTEISLGQNPFSATTAWRHLGGR